MWKPLKPATAIALALGLSACVNLESPFSLTPGPGEPFSRPSISADKGEIANEMRLADASLKAGNAAAAISIYRRLAREYPLALKPRIALGEALLAANAPQEAARAFEGALKLRADSYAALTGLGRVELALHQPAEALDHFNRAAPLAPKDTTAQNGRAVALDQLGRHEEAQAVYLSLLAKEPSNIRIRNNYALSLALAGKYDDSADILSGLAAAPDSETRIRQNLALVYGLSGNDGQAAHVARMDLDEEAVANNLQYYQRLRHTSSDISKGGALLNPGRGASETAAPSSAKPATADLTESPATLAEMEELPVAVPALKTAQARSLASRPKISRALGNALDDQITDEGAAISAFATPAETGANLAASVPQHRAAGAARAKTTRIETEAVAEMESSAPGNAPEPAPAGLGEGLTGALGPVAGARVPAVPGSLKGEAPSSIPRLRREAAPPPTG